MSTDTLAANVILFVVGLFFLTSGADLLVREASRLAARVGIPSVVVGLTIVAFGTSLPELVVSVYAHTNGGSPEIAIGNVVGSNIANLGLILGVAGLMTFTSVERHLLFREYPLMLLATLIFVAMAWDGIITRFEGIVLVVGLVAFTTYSYMAERDSFNVDEADVDDSQRETHFRKRYLLGNFGLIGLSIGGLWLGAHWLVDSVEFIARSFGVSELVIGLTVVAIGTSLPELATTIVSIIRKQGDIAVGNAVGSNIFNILCVIGITAFLKPLPSPLHMRQFEYPIMVAVSLLLFVLVLPQPHGLTRWKGLVLVGGYLIYSVWIFAQGGLPLS